MPKEKFLNPKEKGGIPSDNVSGWYESLRKGGMSEEEIEEIIGKTNPEFVVRQHDPKGKMVWRAERLIQNSKDIIRVRGLFLSPDKEEELRQLVYGLQKEAMDGNEPSDGETQKRILDFVSRL